MNSFRSIIELWPSREALASDIGAKDRQVSKWWQRDRIPSDWWSALLATERAQSAGVTSDLLTDLGARVPADARE